jgi:crotonobetainyl-CoA:carnitine CoA-transferase CaiB-like acyl-CoA transferase
VENFRPGTLDRLGLGPTVLAEVNPRLVLVQMSGFGQTGPLRHRGGFDRVGQAYGGMTYVTGHPDGGPVRAGLSVVDVGSAVWAALGAVMALYWRDRIGQRGQVVDMALYEAMVPYWFDLPIQYQLAGIVQERTGNRHPGGVPGDVYRSADGSWVHISATGDRSFADLAAAMERPELVDDERFRTTPERNRNADAIEAEVAAWVAELSLDDVLIRCEEHGVPASRIMSMADIHAEAHVWERGDLVEVEDPVLGRLHVSGVVPKLSVTPGRIDHLGPATPGLDNDEVYGRLAGLDADALADLASRGVI